ncbi:hypothetical protein L0222_25020 [bacterium]|nr:hypothetical protein [bacterium]
MPKSGALAPTKMRSELFYDIIIQRFDLHSILIYPIHQMLCGPDMLTSGKLGITCFE